MTEPATQPDLFREARTRKLNTWAWGVGVDSTAGIIEMHSRGIQIDMVLTADMPERAETLRFRDVFIRWMQERDIPVEIVRYQPQKFKNYPRYASLLENCLTNGTLPSIAFGFSSCSAKWKAAPQNAWMNTWEPAVSSWAQGVKVIKNIGYDNGPRDSQRYAHAEGYGDDKYEYRYPLREWQWDRQRCDDRIFEELGVRAVKSSCFFCTAMKMHEVESLNPTELRLIVLLEARAAPRLTTTEGLWRRSTKGIRGPKKPGRMTDFIRDRGLLPAEEIDRIWNECPTALIAWQEAHADTPLETRPALHQWVEFFDRNHGLFEGDGVRQLYGEAGYHHLRRNLDELRRAA